MVLCQSFMIHKHMRPCLNRNTAHYNDTIYLSRSDLNCSCSFTIVWESVTRNVCRGLKHVNRGIKYCLLSNCIISDSHTITIISISQLNECCFFISGMNSKTNQSLQTHIWSHHYSGLTIIFALLMYQVSNYNWHNSSNDTFTDLVIITYNHCVESLAVIRA